MKRLAAEIAARLRSERARLNLTLREAGEQSGLHFGSISRYEQGKAPTVEALYLLAKLYGVEPTAFMPSLASVATAVETPKGKAKK